MITAFVAVATLIAITDAIAQPASPPASGCDGGPGARSGHALAFDPGIGAVVLFGGLDPSKANPFPRSLWGWDGTAWRCLAGTGPVGRIDGHLAFDQARGRLVLFGGRQLTRDRKSIFLRDTWEWDGRSWARVDTAGPGPRIHGAMEYDPARRAIVLHGGGGEHDMLRDSWEWRDGRWTTLSATVPAPTIGNSLTITGQRLALLVARRDSTPGCIGRRRAALYTLHGDSLRAHGAEGPCFSPQAPAAATPEGLVLFAGWNDNDDAVPAESWTWDGRAWRQVATSPPKRRGASMAFDARRGRAVLYGGEGVGGLLADVWEFDGTRWIQVKS